MQYTEISQLDAKSRLQAWMDAHVVKGFWKSYTFISNALGVLIGLVPDLLNLAVSNWSMVDGLPTLAPEHKLYLFAGINVLNLFLRGIKQRNMPQPTIPVAVVPVPKTVDVGTVGGGTVEVATQIVHVDRDRTEAGPQ